MAASHPDHLAPYVEALGEDLAIEFLIAFGGSPLYLSDAPGSLVLTVLDRPAFARLREMFGSSIARVPTARAWIAQRRPTPPPRRG